MNKSCKFCDILFVDKTSNKNRSHCGSKSCKKEQSKLYRESVDPVKKKLTQQRFKEKNPNYLKEWRKENTEQDRKLNREYRNKRLKEDINFRLAHNLRVRLKNAIKNNQKKGSAVDDLGCSVEELKKHLELQFKDNMSWDNYGNWHIDHVKPLSKYNLEDREQLKEACNYKNLQPLWAEDNLSKGSKYAL